METTLHANPGGYIPAAQVIGRDDLIRQLWRVLRRQSLVLSAERRIGKTSLMKKMIDEAADPVDPWDLQHYLDRISTYYSASHQPIVLGLLDALANASGPLDFEMLFNGLKATVVTEDRETTRSVLTMLQHDHYVLLLPDGRYRFVFPLVKRWWSLRRG